MAHGEESAMPQGEAVEPALTTAIETELRDWQTKTPGRSCPLPELYSHVREKHPSTTIGQFHDSLRQLYADNRVRLLPFTQAMYQLQGPEYVLLVGRELMYYAELP
jgi:hypothetical protein